MNLLLDSFWRAMAYCMHPRVMLVSIFPLLLMGGLMAGLGYFFWESALDQISAGLQSSELMTSAWAWLERIGAGQLKTVLAPMIVIAGVTPLVVIGSLLVVALLMTPVIVRMVAQRRFADLARLQGSNWWGSAAWTLGSTALAVLVMVISTPLWLVPPFVLLLPPLIWGWLTYRVMAYDALAEHASVEERHTIFRTHRISLMGMGIFVGFLGAGPSLVWSGGVFTIVLAPILVPVSIWLYTLIFAFSSLWFSHYCLAVLRNLRQHGADADVVDAASRVVAEPLELL